MMEMINSWIIHDMVRICPQTGAVLEDDANRRSVQEWEEGEQRLTAPRNGYVSFQLIVDRSAAGSGMDHSGEIDIALAPLTGLNDAIAVSEYKLFVEWYHQIERRYMPDALIPLEQLPSGRRSVASIVRLNQVPGHRYAAIWIDLFVPDTLPAGDYEGTIAVRTSGSETRHTVKLQALSVVLPQTTTITADLNAYADVLSKQIPELNGRDSRYRDGSYFQFERQFHQLAHEHRCLIHYLPYDHSGGMPESFCPELEGRGENIRVKDWALFDEHFGPYLDGSAFKDSKRGAVPISHFYLPFNFHWPADYVNFGKKGYKVEFQRILEQFYEHFTSKGWLHTKFELFLNHKKRYKLFPYDGDETRFASDEKTIDIYYNLAKDVIERKGGAQFVFRTDASWSYGLHYNKFADQIGLWVVNEQIFSWFPEALEYLHDKGCEVWSYGGEQSISENLLGTAISPLMCVARGVDGFNYWNTVVWGQDWRHTPQQDGRVTMFYPGSELFGIQGPIPSIRLKTIRNAMQLAEAAEQWIAEQSKDGRAQVRSCINHALEVGDAYWWADMPDIVNKPPHEWTNQLLSLATAADFHQRKSPELLHQVADSIWALTEEEAADDGI